jgi:uncharacterized tellurite resistance protein B-like protein
VIIWGSRGVTSTVRKGTFYCPNCTGERNYELKKVRRFFTLYFIPLIPMGTISEYVQCLACQGAFKDIVLQYNPKAELEAFTTQHHLILRQVLTRMMLIDGPAQPSEIDRVHELYSKTAGSPIPEKEFAADLASTEEGRFDIGQIERVAVRLTEQGKEDLVKGAVLVGVADGELNDKEKAFLSRLTEKLGVSSAHLRGIIAEVTQS